MSSCLVFRSFLLVIGAALIGPVVLGDERGEKAGTPPIKKEARFKGKPTSYWIEKLRSNKVESRLEGLSALQQIGTEAEKAVPTLVKLLDDDDEKVRIATLDTLTAIGTGAKAAIPALLEAAEDKDVDYRSRAISALVATGIVDKDVAAALGKLLVDKSVPSNTRESTLACLQELGPKAVKFALPFLRKALKDDSLGHCLVIETMASAGPEAKEAVPDLISALKDKDESYKVRVAAATALGQIGSEAVEAIPVLKEAMKNDAGPPDTFEITGTTGPLGTGEPVKITLERPPKTPAEKAPKDKEAPPLTQAAQEAIKKIKGNK